MKVEVATDARGTPVGLATGPANVAETALAPAALADIPAAARAAGPAPVVADRGYGSDKLRDALAAGGFRLLAPHRKSRVAPSRNDGRRMRRYKRRWVVERTCAWLHSYRRAATRFEKTADLFTGFVHLACAFVALNRLL